MNTPINLTPTTRATSKLKTTLPNGEVIHYTAHFYFTKEGIIAHSPQYNLNTQALPTRKRARRTLRKMIKKSYK